MKKKLLNLRGISDILSEKEMKNVVGGSSGAGSGSSGYCFQCSQSPVHWKCTSSYNSCLNWAGTNCPGGWMEWTPNEKGEC